MGGTLTKEEMGAKIENAFHSIGVEEGFRRGFKRLDLEFKIRTYKPGFNPQDDTVIESALNDGWWLTDKIICLPFVTLIFSREKETKENERE